jgi:hypothetical protein
MPLDKDLLAQATELGVSVEGIANDEALDRAVQARMRELARGAVVDAKKVEEEEAQRAGAFDEVMGQTRGVLVRIVEWTEWLPMIASEHLPQLGLQNGVTGFEAGENEKVVDIDVSRTGQTKEVDYGDEGKKQFQLYAFQAKLAQNVRTDLIATLIDNQGGDKEGNRVMPSRLITPNGPPPTGNRAAKRRKKS